MGTVIKGVNLFDGVNFKAPSPKEVFLENGRIAQISDKIDMPNAEVIDLKGSILTPGLIDLHVHCSDGFAVVGYDADVLGRDVGSTAVFDAGTAGADNFEYFLKNIIQKADTKIFSWLNISSKGLATRNELNDMSTIEFSKIKDTLEKYPEIVKGLKARASGSVVGTNGIKPIGMGKDIATRLNLPVMVHIGNPPPDIDDILNLLTAGDVVTHCYHNKEVAALFTGGKIRETAAAARERGVLFDVGHGNASFSFDMAHKMIAAGFKPDFISTDLHHENYIEPVKSQLLTINKMVHCGLTFDECIIKTTSKIADKFGLKDIGQLKEGYIADLTAMKLYMDKPIELLDSVRKSETCNVSLEKTGVFINGIFYK